MRSTVSNIRGSLHNIIRFEYRLFNPFYLDLSSGNLFHKMLIKSVEFAINPEPDFPPFANRQQRTLTRQKAIRNDHKFHLYDNIFALFSQLGAANERRSML